MPSKIRISTALLLTLPTLAFALDKAVSPVSEPIKRYQDMVERSPFALATETAPPPAPDLPGFAKDLVLTGAVRLNKGEYITIISRDQTQRFCLTSGEPYNGISLVNVTWSDVVGKTKATLKRGSEYGVIGFDEANARSGPVATPAAGNTPAQGTAKESSVQPSGNGASAPPTGQNSATPQPSPIPPDIAGRRLLRAVPFTAPPP